MKQKIKDFLGYVGIIFMPSYWIQVRKYSEVVDKWFIASLKEPKFSYAPEHLRGFKVILNGKYIWVANRPYGLAVLPLDMRPSRLTIRRFYTEYDDWVLNGDKSA